MPLGQLVDRSQMSPPANTATTAQRRLADCLALLVRGEPTGAEVAELFGPAFLEAVPAETLASMLGSQLEVAAAEPVSVATKGDYELVAVVPLTNGSLARFMVRTEEEAPYRFVGFDVGAAAAADGVRVPWDQFVAAEPAATTMSELPAALTARLDGLVAAHRGRHRTPGLIALVADDRARLLWWRAEGVASLEPLAAPSTSMAVRIGSVTKTVTALAVMQQVEAGRVDLDAPAQDYLTSVQLTGPAAGDVTVRRLITHTGALAPRPSADIGVDEGQPVPPLSQFYADGVMVEGTPGQAWAYSNDGFALLGQLVEDVAGMPLREYAATYIFDPLGMTQTNFGRDQRVTAPLFEGLDLELDHVVAAPYREIIVEGAGSVFSTPTDMARYGAAVLGRGGNDAGRVLQPTTFDQLLAESDVALPQAGLHMGLGWVLGAVDSSPLVWHNGGWPGAKTELAVLPDKQRSVLVFANTMDEGLDELCFSLVGEVVRAR